MADPNKDDISFGFNSKPFAEGINQILKKLGMFKNKVADIAKGTAQGIMNVTKKIAGIFIAFKGIRGVFNQIPEIGKAFGIAKEIAFKNFFFPLRQAVFPLLQKLLNWVRDHRKIFVIWGQALANVFNIVVSNLKGVMEFGKSLGHFFLNFINRIFGTQLKNFEELVNMVTFKIAVTIEFLKALLSQVSINFAPILDEFAKLAQNVLPIITGLVTGFLNGVKGIGRYFTGIVNSVNAILAGWIEIDKHGNRINSVAESIGRIFGTIIKFGTNALNSFLKGITPYIIKIKEPLKAIADVFDRLFNKPENAKKWQEVFKAIGEIAGTVLKDAFNVLAGIVDLIAQGIEKILNFFVSEDMKKFFEFLQIGWDLLTGKGIDLGPSNRETVRLSKQTQERLGVDEFGRPKKVKDVIITKKGDVIQTAPDDTIMAFKKFPDMLNANKGGEGKVNHFHLDFSGMQLHLAGVTTNEAKRFADDIVDMVIDGLNKDLISSGIA